MNSASKKIKKEKKNSASGVLKILIINNFSSNDISLKSMSVNILKEYGAVWMINRKYKVMKQRFHISCLV